MPPPTPKKTKSTAARTSDPEKGLDALDFDPKTTPRAQIKRNAPLTSPGTPYSPAEEVDIGSELTSEQVKEKADIAARQDKFVGEMKEARGQGRKSRKHKKSKKSRKTRKAKKHGKRKA